MEAEVLFFTSARCVYVCDCLQVVNCDSTAHCPRPPLHAAPALPSPSQMVNRGSTAHCPLPPPLTQHTAPPSPSQMVNRGSTAAGEEMDKLDRRELLSMLKFGADR